MNNTITLHRVTDNLIMILIPWRLEKDNVPPSSMEFNYRTAIIELLQNEFNNNNALSYWKKHPPDCLKITYVHLIKDDTSPSKIRDDDNYSRKARKDIKDGIVQSGLIYSDRGDIFKTDNDTAKSELNINGTLIIIRRIKYYEKINTQQIS